MKQVFDNRTLDLFGEQATVSSRVLKDSEVRGTGNLDNIARLNWWLSPERDLMRNDDAWSKVFAHLRAAVHMQALTLPARSGSEDSQRKRASGAPLGIYGENAVTSGVGLD